MDFIELIKNGWGVYDVCYNDNDEEILYMQRGQYFVNGIVTKKNKKGVLEIRLNKEEKLYDEFMQKNINDIARIEITFNETKGVLYQRKDNDTWIGLSYSNSPNPTCSKVKECSIKEIENKLSYIHKENSINYREVAFTLKDGSKESFII